METIEIIRQKMDHYIENIATDLEQRLLKSVECGWRMTHVSLGDYCENDVIYHDTVMETVVELEKRGYAVKMLKDDEFDDFLLGLYEKDLTPIS